MKNITRPHLIVCGLVLIAALLYAGNEYRLLKRDLQIQPQDFSATYVIPDLTAPTPVSASVGSFDLWRLNEPPAMVSDPTFVEESLQNKVYQVLLKQGQQLICRGMQESDCWAFYGVAREGQTYRGLFYNATKTENSWLQLTIGEELAPDLFLETIDRDRVVLGYRGADQADYLLSLKIFAVDIDAFTRKDTVK